MKKSLLLSLILLSNYASAQIVLGNETSKPVKAGEILNQMNNRSGIVSPGGNTKILKGSDANVLSPRELIPTDSVTISKKDYENELKRKGLTQEEDLKRAKSLEVGNDGIIRSDIDYITKENGISIFEAQRQQMLQDIEDAKNAVKIESVDDNNAYFFESVNRNIEKSKALLDSIEKEILYKKINVFQYDRLEKQIEMMNVLIESKYSKEVDRKANEIKTRIYNVMRQMYPYIWMENIKGLDINSFGMFYKTLKIYSPEMDSNEVVKLKAIVDGAFVIGYEKVVFTNQKGYVVEENVKDYIKKIKELKNKK